VLAWRHSAERARQELRVGGRVPQLVTPRPNAEIDRRRCRLPRTAGVDGSTSRRIQRIPEGTSATLVCAPGCDDTWWLGLSLENSTRVKMWQSIHGELRDTRRTRHARMFRSLLVTVVGCLFVGRRCHPPAFRFLTASVHILLLPLTVELNAPILGAIFARPTALGVDRERSGEVSRG
jgi:hypothetical protein